MDTLKKILKDVRFWLILQLFFLVWGNYVGWSTIYSDIQFFCLNEAKGLDALLSFSGTVTTNPMLSPCFWGTLSFTFSLLWTVRLILLKDEKQRVKEYKTLLYVLAGSALFALLNNIPLFYRFYTTPKGTATSCSPGKLLTNPFATSCFYGLSAFAGATIAAYLGRIVPKKLK